MLIATWNVNSIRARQPRLLDWLESRSPDVVCLQELEVTDDAFPHDALREAGYESVAWGQKTYNGVAILGRSEPTDVRRGLGDESLDEQARLIAASVGPLRVICVYVPNGDVVGSEKYDHKRQWLSAFAAYLDGHDLSADPIVVCGDFNIARDENDVAQPELWGGSVLFHPEMRETFAELLDLGLEDLFRAHHPEGGEYSWWDYRQLAFPRNHGLRIDHILATAPAAGHCTAAWIDREARKGPKPSDHAPVLARFESS